MYDDNPDEPTIPRAALNKMIKDSAPGFRFANETRDLVHSCCLEFIKLVAGEANKICVQECKKTISNEHTIKALNMLGFGIAYEEAAGSVLGECKEAAQKRLKRLNSRLEKCGVPVEELEKQQAELFEKARQEQAEIEQAEIARLLHERDIQRLQQQNASTLQQQKTVALNNDGVKCNNRFTSDEDEDTESGEMLENGSTNNEQQQQSSSSSTSAAPKKSLFTFELDENYDID